MSHNIITYGTFDLFHIGHLRLLERAKALGDKLLVAVSTDEFNATKGKRCIIPFDQRAEIVRSIRCVDSVIPEHSWEQKEHDIRAHRIHTFVMGDDWRGKFDYLGSLCEVVYLERTEGVSTTALRQSITSALATEDPQHLITRDILERLRQDLS